MGRTHAASGAVAWLAAAGVAASVGHPMHVTTVVFGAVATAGAALLPDLDHPCSTVARTAGPVSQAVCRGIARGCAWVHAATRTTKDRPDLDGHRTLSHTAVAAVVFGLLATSVGLFGARAGSVVVATLVTLGLRGVVRRRRHRLVPLAGGLLTGLAGWFLLLSTWWLGIAVTLGCLTHCLGDAMTNSGCPIVWPVKIRGQRWYRLGTPRVVRFGTGGVAEQVVAVLLVGVGLLEVTWLGQIW